MSGPSLPPLGAISIRNRVSEPWVAAPVEASVVPKREACVGAPGGERRGICVHPSRPQPARAALAGGDAGGGSSGES